MVLPTVTEIPLPLQRVEYDRFADALALRDPQPPAGVVVAMPVRTRPPLRIAA